MKRRLFISGLLVSGYALLFNGKLSAPGPSDSTVLLDVNSSHYVQAGSLLCLPTEAKQGDFVQLIIDQESLLKESCLISNVSRIMADNEPLILDQMAIIKFTYDSGARNWTLG